MRLLIIRHGDPDYTNDSLTEKGRREAQLLAEKLSKEKIDYIYSSPLGRAKETCMYVSRALNKENDVVVLDWLREFFDASAIMPGRDNPDIIWDLYPDEWTKYKKLYSKNEWLEYDFLKNSNVGELYEQVGEGLNKLLKKHGYTNMGGYYKVENSNEDTIALFCHFGLEMIIISHILGVSPIPLLQGFTALTTSVTTFYTEERRKGIASLRCCGFSDISHLYVANEPPSFHARFCEVFDSDDRH